MGEDVSLLAQLAGLGLFPFPGRRRLTANRIYYVRSDGSNSNSGLANTAGGAFLTIQQAVDAIAALDLNGFAATVQVADGTYTTAVVLKNAVGFAAAGSLVIQGNNATPANVVISVSVGDCIGADGIGSIWDIKDLKIIGFAASSGACISAKNGATVRFGNLNFGVNNSSGSPHLLADGGRLLCLSSYAISGSAVYHWQQLDAGFISASGFTVTLTGTPAFSGFFAYAGLSGGISAYGMTFIGSATGARYTAFAGATIFVNGGGNLPGNSAGSTASGGNYA